MNILNRSFVYVPPQRQEQDGVLSRWLKQRDRQRETDKETLEHGNVVFGDRAPGNEPHAG